MRYCLTSSLSNLFPRKDRVIISPNLPRGKSHQLHKRLMRSNTDMEKSIYAAAKTQELLKKSTRQVKLY